MYLRHLSVADFRSWPAAELAMQPGPTLLVGPNGQGKTNLVEALGYLATLGSHRVATDAPLVRHGSEHALVRGAAVADGRELRVEVEITAGRANRARLGGAPQARARDILGVVRRVLFAPEDLAVVRGDPAERRRFLDELVVARSPRMAGVRSDYERVLKQRGALLKSAGAAGRGSAGVGATLDVWDQHLAEHGSQLLAARLDLVRLLRPHAAAAYGQLAPSEATLSMRYLSTIGARVPYLSERAAEPAAEDADAEVPGTEVPDASDLAAALLAELAAMRSQELDRGVNLVGPHRDDLELAIGPLPVRGYASHGEGWSAALALRLGSFELLSAESAPGTEPILVLDDVFAELDAGRRDQLARVAGKAEQAIVTAAVAADVPPELAGARFDVADGEVRRAG